MTASCSTLGPGNSASKVSSDPFPLGQQSKCGAEQDTGRKGRAEKAEKAKEAEAAVSLRGRARASLHAQVTHAVSPPPALPPFPLLGAHTS